MGSWPGMGSDVAFVFRKFWLAISEIVRIPLGNLRASVRRNHLQVIENLFLFGRVSSAKRVPVA